VSFNYEIQHHKTRPNANLTIQGKLQQISKNAKDKNSTSANFTELPSSKNSTTSQYSIFQNKQAVIPFQFLF
jgi:hypothetical protein